MITQTNTIMSPKPKSYFPTILISLLIILQPIIFTISSSSSSLSSLHSLLRAHGLPGGLFPENVESFDLDPSTGLLEVRLEWPCLSKFETRVFYASVVRANLTFGGLSDVEGLSQEELFLWLPVKGITVNDPSSGLISFDLGLANKQLSLSLFEDPPVCRPQETRKHMAFEGKR